MRKRSSTLFYAIIGVFLTTAAVTLLGVTGVVNVDPDYLNPLFTLLIVEVIAAVITLFKTTDWFGSEGSTAAVNQITGDWWQMLGVGVVKFVRSAGREGSKDATGWFTAGDIEQGVVSSRVKVEYHRAPPEDVEIMDSGDRKDQQAFVTSVYSRWSSLAVEPSDTEVAGAPSLLVRSPSSMPPKR
jgi:hypothetical protein